MFRKPFKLKFQIQLKSTEKKKFGADLMVIFPALGEQDVASLVGGKESVVRMKVTTFKDEEVEIYCVNKVPIYLDVIDAGVRLPTVFMLWRFPNMLPAFTTNAVVLSKLRSGADLFFPGIYTEGLFFGEAEYRKKEAAYANLIDNRAAMAVGVSLVDRDEVIDGDKWKEVGKVMRIYHTTGDLLFKMSAEAVVLQLGPPDWALPVNEEMQTKIQSKVTPKADGAYTVDGLTEEIDAVNLENSQKTEKNSVDAEKEKNDELLEYSFLKALKMASKNSYPILPATFYAKHVLPSVPEGQILNLRKTKWKKFSAFLQEKALEGLIRLQPLPKNDFTIASVDANHPCLKEFVDPHAAPVESKIEGKVSVQQVYSVTAVTQPFFARFGLKKHDEITRNDVRNYLNDYIKNESLVHPVNPEMVVLDPVLVGVLGGEEVVGRGALLSGLLGRMGVRHKISTCGNENAITHKGKMPLIEFETCLRTGNKKVTLINNLESYGVNIGVFSKQLQHKAAASTSITPSVPGKKGPQVQVQGNQIAVAVSILKDKYNINEKFMKGIEKAMKSKNKK